MSSLRVSTSLLKVITSEFFIMKKENIIKLSFILYLTLAVLVVFAARWYVDAKDWRERNKAIQELENFFSEQEMFVSTLYSGFNVEYDEVPIPSYDDENITKIEWHKKWDGTYKLFKLKPHTVESGDTFEFLAGIKRELPFKRGGSGFLFTAIRKNISSGYRYGFDEYEIYPHQVAYKKQPNFKQYNYPSIQEAIDQSYKFYADNDKSYLKSFMTEERRRFYGGGYWYGDDYYIFFSYEQFCLSNGEEAWEHWENIIKSKSLSNQLYNFRKVKEEDKRYTSVGNSTYEVEMVVEPIAYWDLCYNFFTDPKTKDRKHIIIWGESILAIIESIFLFFMIASINKRRKILEESLKDRLLRECNPSNFMRPYDEKKIAVANELFNDILKLTSEDVRELKQIRKKAATSLGVDFIDKEFIKELKEKSNPKRFLIPYNAEKVKLANQIYPRLMASDLTIDELEDIVALMKNKLLNPDYVENS